MDAMAGKDLFNRLATLLGDDTVTLGKATATAEVYLIMAPFTPSRALTLTGVTEAAFTGYTTKPVEDGPALVYTEQSTGDRLIQLKTPLGGWHWETTGAVSPAVTIYGFMVWDTATQFNFGSGLFTPPVVLDGIDQAVDIDSITLRIPQSALT